MEIMTNKIQINLRVTEEMKKQIEKQAKEEQRSVNNLLEHIVSEYLKKVKH